MRDEQDRLLRLCQTILQPALAWHVEVVVWLVEQHYLNRAAQQRLKDEALLLAPGERFGAPPLDLLMRDAEGRHRALVPRGLGLVAANVGPVGQRLRVGQLGGLVVTLHNRQLGRVDGEGRVPDDRPRHGDEQVADRPLVPDRPDELRHHAEPAARRDGPRIRLELAGDQLQQRTFARAVRADEGDRCGLSDAEAHVGQEQPPVGQVVIDVGDFEMTHGCHHGVPPGASPTG